MRLEKFEFSPEDKNDSSIDFDKLMQKAKEYGQAKNEDSKKFEQPSLDFDPLSVMPGNVFEFGDGRIFVVQDIKIHHEVGGGGYYETITPDGKPEILNFDEIQQLHELGLIQIEN